MAQYFCDKFLWIEIETQIEESWLLYESTVSELWYKDLVWMATVVLTKPIFILLNTVLPGWSISLSVWHYQI